MKDGAGEPLGTVKVASPLPLLSQMVSPEVEELAVGLAPPLAALVGAVLVGAVLVEVAFEPVVLAELTAAGAVTRFAVAALVWSEFPEEADEAAGLEGAVAELLVVADGAGLLPETVVAEPVVESALPDPDGLAAEGVAELLLFGLLFTLAPAPPEADVEVMFGEEPLL